MLLEANMATSKVNGDFILKLLVGILFVVIGIEGIANFGGNDLYQKLDEALRIIVGVVILVAGLLMIVPSFIGGIKKSLVKVSTLIALIAWIVYIVLADFVYGLRGVDGKEWFLWIENLVYHLLILYCVYRVASPAVKQLGNK